MYSHWFGEIVPRIVVFYCNRLKINCDDAHSNVSSRPHIMTVIVWQYTNGPGASVMDPWGVEATLKTGLSCSTNRNMMFRDD